MYSFLCTVATSTHGDKPLEAKPLAPTNLKEPKTRSSSKARLSEKSLFTLSKDTKKRGKQ